MPAVELWSPEQFAWWVLALGVGLLVAVVGWYIVVFRSTREPRPDAPQQLGRGERGRFDARVTALFERYHAEDLDLRGLHLELARAMREYATLQLGRDVSSWTASEVNQAQPDSALGELLTEWEEPSFARRSDAEAQQAVSSAREVIARG